MVGVTVVAYLTLLLLGKRWRKSFEAKGFRYWTASKEERVKELTDKIWQPKLVTTLYGLTYFTNGYSRTVFSMWAPFFLLQIRGLDVVSAALFTSLIYSAWSWKMFLGLLTDALPMRWRGKSYRRLQWFLITGILYLGATSAFIFMDPYEMPIWSTLLLVISAIITAGALYDSIADAYVVDVVPPDWHARVLGSVNIVGRSLGGALACILPPLLIPMGGYRLVFLTAGLSGITAFPCLLLKEPQMAHERTFNREAIAFTFTEKAVIFASVFQLSQAFSLRKLANPLGGLFSFVLQKSVGATSELIGRIGLVVLLGGMPGSIVGGWMADKWGHKRTYAVSLILASISGILWTAFGINDVVLFVIFAIITSFLSNSESGAMLALMGDMTPLALSSTVFQMYMSFLWMTNVPVSVTTGHLLSINLPTLLMVTSLLSFAPLAFIKFVKPYETAKAMKV